MLRIKIRTLFLLTAAFLVLGVSQVQAQESTKPFEARFWQFLIGNNYKQWAPGPGQDGDFYSGQVPHGALLKMYINRSAATSIAGLKVGSVVVLENYRTDRSLKSISVMYRTEGFNPSANDWYWVEYNPDGTVVEDASANQNSELLLASDSGSSNKLMGKAQQCINCHNQAGGSDFAFFNDNGSSNVAGRKKPEAISLR